MPRKTPFLNFNLFYHNEPIISIEDVHPDSTYNGAVQDDAQNTLNYNFKRMDFVLQSILGGHLSFNSLRTTQDVIAGRDVVVGRDLRVDGAFLLTRDERPSPHILLDFSDVLTHPGQAEYSHSLPSKPGIGFEEASAPFRPDIDSLYFGASESPYPVVLERESASGPLWDASVDATCRFFVAFTETPENLQSILLEFSYDGGASYTQSFLFDDSELLTGQSFLSDVLLATGSPDAVRITLEGTNPLSGGFGISRLAVLAAAQPSLEKFFVSRAGGSYTGPVSFADITAGGITAASLAVVDITVDDITLNGSLTGLRAFTVEAQAYDEANYPDNQNPHDSDVQVLLDGLRKSVNDIIDNDVGVFSELTVTDAEVTNQLILNGVDVAPRLKDWGVWEPSGETLLGHSRSVLRAVDAGLDVYELRINEGEPFSIVDIFGRTRVKGNMLLGAGSGVIPDATLHITQDTANNSSGILLEASGVLGRLWASAGGLAFDAYSGGAAGELLFRSGGSNKLTYQPSLSRWRSDVPIAITPPQSGYSEALAFNHGYAFYADNTGPGSDNSRLWLTAPNGGQIVLGPRSGSSTLDNLRIRANHINLMGKLSVNIATTNPAGQSKRTLTVFQDTSDYNSGILTRADSGKGALLYAGSAGINLEVTTPDGVPTSGHLNFRAGNAGKLSYKSDTDRWVFYTPIELGDVFEGFYAGRVSSTGSGIRLPAGWSTTKTSTGVYRLTHNLGTTSYSIVGMALRPKNIGFFSISSNYVDVVVTDGGTNSDSEWNFTLVRY